VEIGTVAVASRSAYSSATFAQSNEKDPAKGVPTSSIVDRRVIVGWGPNEKSQLYVTHASLAMGTDDDRQP